jgi:hypothetical protein
MVRPYFFAVGWVWALIFATVLGRRHSWLACVGDGIQKSFHDWFAREDTLRGTGAAVEVRNGAERSTCSAGCRGQGAIQGFLIENLEKAAGNWGRFMVGKRSEEVGIPCCEVHT